MLPDPVTPLVGLEGETRRRGSMRRERVWDVNPEETRNKRKWWYSGCRNSGVASDTNSNLATDKQIERVTN